MGAGTMEMGLVGFPLFVLLIILPLMVPRAEWKILAGFAMMLMLMGMFLIGVGQEAATDAAPLRAMPEAVQKVPTVPDND